MKRSAVFCAIAESVPQSAELESTLGVLVDRGRAAWPHIDLDESIFLRHLAERADGDVLGHLAACHAEDLWLSCACGRGDPRALDAFVKAHMTPVAAYLSRIKAAHLADDVRQILLTRFFVADGDEPKILEYRGKGALAGWVRIAAVRVALGLTRAPRNDTGDSLPDLAGPVDVELDALKITLRDDFARAFREAFAAISPREHTLLKLHYGEHVPVESLARLYRVHRVSVSRWLAEARARVFEETRERLRTRLSLSDSEFTSVTRLVQSQLDVSLGRLFRTGGAAPP